MKSLFTLAAILFSVTLFAGNEKTNVTDKDKTKVIENISQLMGGEEVIYLLEYHLRKSIDGVKMIVSDSLVGKTVSFFVNVVQSK